MIDTNATSFLIGFVVGAFLIGLLAFIYTAALIEDIRDEHRRQIRDILFAKKAHTKEG